MSLLLLTTIVRADDKGQDGEQRASEGRSKDRAQPRQPHAGPHYGNEELGRRPAQGELGIEDEDQDRQGDHDH
jgi:hypothetical protein